MHAEKMTIGDAMIGLAASVTARARELLADGWVKGRWHGGFGGVEEFCIHGALNLALDETFGKGSGGNRRACQLAGREEVEALATAYIVDEAATHYGFSSRAHSAIGFNDAPERKHSEVLRVMGGASDRLWSLLADDPQESVMTPSQWVDSATAEVQDFLRQSLVPA